MLSSVAAPGRILKFVCTNVAQQLTLNVRLLPLYLLPTQLVWGLLLIVKGREALLSCRRELEGFITSNEGS